MPHGYYRRWRNTIPTQVSAIVGTWRRAYTRSADAAHPQTRAELDRDRGALFARFRGRRDAARTCGCAAAPAPSQLFLARMTAIARLLSLAAGMVFFVAANWSKFAVFGRFALLEIAAVPARWSRCWKPPPRLRARRAVSRVYHHRRIAGAVRPDLPDRRRRLRVVPHLDVVRPAARYRRALERGIGGLGAGAQHGVAAVLRLAPTRWIVVDVVRQLAFPAGHLILGRGLAQRAFWFAFERALAAVPEWVRRLSFFCAFVSSPGRACSACGGRSLDDRGARPSLLGAPRSRWSRCRVRAAAPRRHLSTGAGDGHVHHRGMVWLADVIDFNDEGLFLLLALWLIGASTVGGPRLMSSCAAGARRAPT